MKRILFGVFAHPDDEGFGPSGTLIQEVDSGTELHLICVTRGEAGTNADNCPDLGKVRTREWHAAGKLIGASSMHCLKYADGLLCNDLYREIADKVEVCIEQTLEKTAEPFELHMMTFDRSGLSGHLDHIAVSMITTFVYLRLRHEHSEWRFGELRYFCVPYDKRYANDISYVYMPPGHEPEDIDETVDVSDVYDRKLDVMRAHRSQRHDMQWHLDNRAESLKTEHFCYFQ